VDVRISALGDGRRSRLELSLAKPGAFCPARARGVFVMLFPSTSCWSTFDFETRTRESGKLLYGRFHATTHYRGSGRESLGAWLYTANRASASRS